MMCDTLPRLYSMALPGDLAQRKWTFTLEKESSLSGVDDFYSSLSSFQLTICAIHYKLS